MKHLAFLSSLILTGCISSGPYPGQTEFEAGESLLDELSDTEEQSREKILEANQLRKQLLKMQKRTAPPVKKKKR